MTSRALDKTTVTQSSRYANPMIQLNIQDIEYANSRSSKLVPRSRAKRESPSELIIKATRKRYEAVFSTMSAQLTDCIKTTSAKDTISMSKPEVCWIDTVLTICRL